MNRQKKNSFTKKERKEFLKDTRSQEEAKSRMRGLVIKLLVTLAILAAVGIVAYVFVSTSKPENTQTLTVGEAVPVQGRNHIEPGTSHPPYNSNPPTSGPHWPEPAKCNVHTEEIPDESAIHSLEHGSVWITYKNKDDKDLVEKLKKLAEARAPKVMLSPRSANDSALAVVSWGKMLKLESYDEAKIIEFIKANKNSAPEPFASC